MRDGRGQLSTPVAEAGLGVILIFAVVTTFALGVPAPDTQQAQLDLYAEDTATALSGEAPLHQDATRLTELARSEGAFEREHERADRRLDELLPDNVLYQIETDHGIAGMERPAGVPYGSTTIPTEHGDVTIRVWYA